MNDESGSIEVLNDEPNYLQVMDDEIGYLQVVKDEPNYFQPLGSELGNWQPINNFSSCPKLEADEPGYLRQVQLADNKLSDVQVAVDDISYLQNVQDVKPANNQTETDYLQ